MMPYTTTERILSAFFDWAESDAEDGAAVLMELEQNEMPLWAWEETE